MSGMAELDADFNDLVETLEREGHSVAAKLRDWYRRATYKTPRYPSGDDHEHSELDAPPAPTGRLDATSEVTTSEGTT